MSGPKHTPNLLDINRSLGPGRFIDLTPEWTWALMEWNSEADRYVQVAGPWDTLDEADAALREAGVTE